LWPHSVYSTRPTIGILRTLLTQKRLRIDADIGFELITPTRIALLRIFPTLKGTQQQIDLLTLGQISVPHAVAYIAPFISVIAVLFPVIPVQYFLPVYVMRVAQSKERRERGGRAGITESAANED